MRDASGLIEAKVRETLNALDLTDADSAAKELAIRYAEVIDESNEADDAGKFRAWAMRWIGPLLLDCLDSLGATPRGRSRMKRGDRPDATASALDQLRAARTAKRG